jgi:branched-chain amino acid transport system substrate-binding protein
MHMQRNGITQIAAFISLLWCLSCLAAIASAAEPVKLGAIFDLSGPHTEIGTPAKLVARMVRDQINREGGINGQPLEILFADTEGDPAKAVLAARRFIEAEGVAAIIGPSTTDSGLAVKSLVEGAKMPTFMTVGSDAVIENGAYNGKNYGKSDWVFKSPPRSSTAVAKIYQYLRMKKVKNIAIITASDGFGADGRMWLLELAPKFGLSIAADEIFGATDTDMKPQLEVIRKAGAEAIICWTVGAAASVVAKNRMELGIQAPLFQCHGMPGADYLNIAGSAAEGNLMPSTKLMVPDQLDRLDPQREVVLTFIDLYERVYRLGRQFPLNAHSGYAWDAIYIVANAIRMAGTDRFKLREAIESIKGYVGVSGVYNLSPQDHNGLKSDSLVIVKIEQGKWIIQMF